MGAIIRLIMIGLVLVGASLAVATALIFWFVWWLTVWIYQLL